MNFFYSDPYAVNVFASGFEWDPKNPPANWAWVTAFEVAEHLPDPLQNFGELFKLSPKHILFSTLLYSGQAADWWYFTNNGQHVAFYTGAASRSLPATMATTWRVTIAICTCFRGTGCGTEFWIPAANHGRSNRPVPQKARFTHS